MWGCLGTAYHFGRFRGDGSFAGGLRVDGEGLGEVMGDLFLPMEPAVV